jgi:hypothetical protein
LMKLKTKWQQKQKQKINQLIIQKWQLIESSTEGQWPGEREWEREWEQERERKRERKRRSIEYEDNGNDETTKLCKW